MLAAFVAVALVILSTSSPSGIAVASTSAEHASELFPEFERASQS